MSEASTFDLTSGFGRTTQEQARSLGGSLHSRPPEPEKKRRLYPEKNEAGLLINALKQTTNKNDNLEERGRENEKAMTTCLEIGHV